MRRLGLFIGSGLLLLIACSSSEDSATTPGGSTGGSAGAGKGGSAGSSAGGTTIVGECAQPTKLLNLTDLALQPDPTIRDIAVDDTTLYAAVEAGDGQKPRLAMVAKAGGSPTEVEVPETPLTVVVDATNIYWASNKSLYRMAKNSTTPEVVTQYYQGSVRKHSIEVDDTYIYFGINRLPKTATNAQKAAFEKLGGEELSGAGAIQLVGDTLYGISGNSLYKMPVSGGAATKLASELSDDTTYFGVCGNWVGWVTKSVFYKVSTTGGSVVTVGDVSNISTDFNGVGCDGSNFYFVAGTAMFRTPAEGGPIEKLGCDGGYRLIVDNTAVYWVGYRDSEVDRLAK